MLHFGKVMGRGKGLTYRMFLAHWLDLPERWWIRFSDPQGNGSSWLIHFWLYPTIRWEYYRTSIGTKSVCHPEIKLDQKLGGGRYRLTPFSINPGAFNKMKNSPTHFFLVKNFLGHFRLTFSVWEIYRRMKFISPDTKANHFFKKVTFSCSKLLESIQGY